MPLSWLALLPLAAAQNVVGGEPVAAGDWPDAAGVYFGNSVDCTGVLIAPTVALTAGHCVGGISAIKIDTNDYSQGGERIRVAETIEYPNSQSTYDVAVLLLETAAQTPPRVIAQDCILDDYLRDGATVTIVGYGATDNNGTRYGTILNEADTTVDDHDCTDIASGCLRSVSPDGELGAGGADDVDSCFGDSGGPLYLRTPEGDFLVGITSRGYSMGGPPCGNGGIYVRPDALIDWIQDVSGVTLPTPDCDGSGGGGGGGGGGGSTNQAPVPTASASELLVVAGGTARTTVAANDPDAGDQHTFSVRTAPTQGTATIRDSGTLSFTADGDAVGTDTLTVAVTDAAGATGLVEIAITIRPREGGRAPQPEGKGGCAVVGLSSGGLWGLLLALPLALRRRRLHR